MTTEGKFRDAGGGEAERIARLSCSDCGKPELSTILANRGGKCIGCFERYVRVPAAQKAADLPNRNDPKAWAHALRERERRGDSLSGAQRTMWRAALRVPEGASA